MSYYTHACSPASRQNFRLPKPKARYPYLPNARSTTRERGNDFRGGLFTQMVVLALLMWKLLLGGSDFPISSWKN